MYKINTYNFKITYDFYKSYDEIKDFKKIFEKRKKYIKDKLCILCCLEDELLSDYFVEIFSWSVMDKAIMDKIKEDIINNYVLKLEDITIVDPCSGNSFHTFLFNKYLSMPVITIDIQPEENAWIDTIECDGLSYIKNMKNHSNKILFLSWIDYTNNELPYNLLINYKGNMIISVGNYREIDCKKYLDELNNKYKLISEYYITMPWNSIEEIKIYVKNN